MAVLRLAFGADDLRNILENKEAVTQADVTILRKIDSLRTNFAEL